MKLVVIQHRLMQSAAQDFEELSESVSRACAHAADVVVCPRVDSIQDGALIARPFLDRVGQCAEGTALLVPFGWQPEDHDSEFAKATPLGETVLLTSDEALDPIGLAALRDASPDALVIRPCSESELQAEGFIELAIGLSQSVAPLVVIAEPVGEGADTQAFGGSCVALGGDLIAEAESEDETELLEVDVDVEALPTPSSPLAEVPRILAQRWAHHQGLQVPMDYPAELS